MKLSDELRQWRLSYFRGQRLPVTGLDGVFRIPYRNKTLHIVSSSGERTGWEHVSVSTWFKRRGKEVSRVPTWEEMCFVKGLFWSPDECVIQYHPAEEEYVNNHEHVLHLWKWTAGEFPTPPSILVGFKELNPDEVKKLLGIS